MYQTNSLFVYKNGLKLRIYMLWGLWLPFIGLCALSHSDLLMVSHQRKLKSDLVYQHQHVQSKLQCAEMCVSDNMCKSASWESTSAVCQLSDKYTVDLGDKNGYLVFASDGTTMSKLFCGVAVYEGPTGRYTLTFNEAVALCADLGLTMASPQDLLDAQSVGYGMCSCGWLSNGYHGLVLSEDDYAGCGYGAVPYVSYCHESLLTADVYCNIP